MKQMVFKVEKKKEEQEKKKWGIGLMERVLYVNDICYTAVNNPVTFRSGKKK